MSDNQDVVKVERVPTSIVARSATIATTVSDCVTSCYAHEPWHLSLGRVVMPVQITRKVENQWKERMKLRAQP